MAPVIAASGKNMAVPARRRLTREETVALYAAHRLRLVRLAVLLVDDPGTAEDLVQDAFAGLMARGRPLRDPDKALAYLRTSVVNGCRSALRRRRTARLYAPPRDIAPDELDGGLILAEEHRAVLAAMGQLAERQREVLVLRYWSGMSEAQIAETLGISAGAVRSTASRGIERAGEAHGRDSMNTTEELLTKALDARAGQVQAEDLSPIAVVVRHRALRPWVVAAALAAVALASPYAFKALSAAGGQGPSGPPPPSTAPGPGEQRTVTGAAADVDGDGRRDDITLKFSERQGAVGGFEITADLSAGGVARGSGPAGGPPGLVYSDFWLPGGHWTPLAIRQPGVDGVDTPTFYELQRGSLVRLSVPDDPPLKSGVIDTAGGRFLLRYTIYRYRLYSYRVGLDPQSGSPTGHGEVWKWRLNGSVLQAVPAHRCQLHPSGVFTC